MSKALVIRRGLMTGAMAAMALGAVRLGEVRSADRSAAEPQAAPVPAALEQPPADPELVELLSGIDFIPGRTSLDGVLGDNALSDLVTLARGQDEVTDPGMRLRAYRALALYPGATADAALREAITEHAQAASGVDTLYLRAAIRSLVAVSGASSIDAIAEVLDHPSRDVRAAAATALGASDSAEAIPLLRDRLAVETVDQVELAIAAALRRLEGS